MASYDFFINLKNFIKGKINPTEFISNTSNSDNVEEIRLDRNKLPQSKIYFDFGNISNVFELLNISDDDAWFYNVITNPYSSYDPIDRSSAIEDFRSGYGLWYALNEENMDKFKLISKVLVPIEFDLNSDKFSNELYDKLYDYSKKELTNIIDAYTNERNNEITTLARDKMEEDLKEYLGSKGFGLTRDNLYTSAADLYYNYLRLGTPHLTPKELIKKIYENEDSVGGWYDNLWEYQSDTVFDNERFNNDVQWELDKIIEKFEDEGNKKYIEMIDRVSSKFPTGEFQFLPKDKSKETRFSIVGYDFPTKKIIVKLQKKLKTKELKLTEENFYNLLYQPELFKIGELAEI